MTLILQIAAGIALAPIAIALLGVALTVAMLPIALFMDLEARIQKRTADRTSTQVRR